MVVWCAEDCDRISWITANDMSASDLRRRQTEAEKNVNRLRNCMPEKLTTFCKMHLSFLLELDGAKLEEMFLEPAMGSDVIKKKNATPFSIKKKERLSAASTSLTKDIVSQLFNLIKFLQKPDNLKTEGLFRKTGNVTRQRLLKEWILQGADLHLNDATFSPHDVATVLKQFIGDLPEPLLTQNHYEAHLQIVDMVSETHTERERLKAKGKQLKALQLMILLLPRENAILLECLIDLLYKVSNVPENKMSASSLGVVFAPSLLCPRKLTPEQMQSASPILSKAVTTLIENAPSMFRIPQELGDDVANFWREMEDPNVTVFDEELTKENLDDKANIQKAKYGSSTAVNTVLTFTERKSPEEYNSNQDTQVALAQLYAHVQSMPESAKKKKLLKQFNHASGAQASTSVRKGKHSRSRTFGESLKKHFPILAKHKQRDACDVNSCATRLTWNITKPVNIDDSMAYTKTPDNKCIPILKSNSPAVHVVDLGASPCNVRPKKRLSDENINAHVKDPKMAHFSNENSFVKDPMPCKALFPCTPVMPRPVAMVSPITKSVTKMGASSKKALMTPRSRIPMMVIQSPVGTYTESCL